MVDANAVPTDSDEIRTLVATANRILYMEGHLQYSGHVSVRDPETDTVYVNSRQQPRGEVTPADVVAVTLDGEPVDPSAPDPVGEREIHTGIYRARDDVTAVLHTHPRAMTLFAMTDAELRPVSQRGSVLAEGPVPRFDRPGKITTPAVSGDMVDAMDGGNQLLIRNHGVVVCDETLVRALVRAIYLEENADWQRRAADLGDVEAIGEEALGRVYDGNWSDRSIEKFWRFYEWKAIEEEYLPESW